MPQFPAYAYVAAAAVVITGRYALRPALRVIAATRAQEAFTAAALLVVVGMLALATVLSVVIPSRKSSTK